MRESFTSIEKLELAVELPALKRENCELKKICRALRVNSISIEAHKQMALEAEADGYRKGYEAGRGYSTRERMVDWI